jgi:hypothetical protein
LHLDARCGADQNDGSAAAAIDDLLRSRHDGVPCAGDVDVDDVAKVFGRDGIPDLGSGDTGVGDDDVEPTQRFDAAVDGLAEPIDVADVDDGREWPVASTKFTVSARSSGVAGS